MPLVVGNVVVSISGRSLAICLLVGLAATALWIAALLSVLVHGEPFRYGTQLIWVLVILLGGPLGALFYFALDRDQRLVPTEAIPGRQGRARAMADPWSEVSQGPPSRT